MKREEVYKDIKQYLGLVPEFLTKVPDRTLELEWTLMKATQMEPGAIPNKYRELIGLGIAATTRCQYCTAFHTEFARVAGATDAEIEEAVHYAKSSAGWSAYLNGLQLNLEQFKREVKEIGAYIRSRT